MSRQPVFVTRKFPPSVGGMETLAAGVWRSLVSVRPGAVKISHGGGNPALVWWLPLSLLRLAVLIARGRVGFVLTGDALTYAAHKPLLWLCRVPNATMVMGLDVTYPNRAYRAVVHPLLRRAPKVIAISGATAERVREIGVDTARVEVLRLGVQAPTVSPADRKAASAQLRKRLRLADSDVIVLTVGRLVRRKGVRWFCEAVLPELDQSVHYVVAGDGAEATAIRAAAEQAGVADRVHLAGKVSPAEFEELMRGADLFVQPNISVPGDMEGFGLVTIEAAMRGTPVVAADLEGIRDAVADGRTGILLPSADGQAWAAKLSELLADRGALDALGARFQLDVRELYGEESMGRALTALLGL